MDHSKKLYRAGKGHVIGGVCAGFADYLSIDVVILRVLWLVLTLIQGVGAIAYIICLVLIPKNPEHEKLPASEQKKAENTGLYIGIALVVIGLTVAFNNWFHFRWWDLDWLFVRLHWNIVWPVLLIIFGVWYIYRSSRKDEGSAAVAIKRLYRSQNQRMIGGVCGGLAEYWNLDVTLVRVGYALATVLTAVWLGVIVYIVMLITVKEREGKTDE
ncbi:PspC domain-containing protein [candidate division KSB1 bacterium]|nr:PspC domain-containing protein [candidate division KSB1 bacterium]RQW09449.1 MAG: PspC domain-containing protein [candidate division KSB1 bacterium]